MQNKRTFDDFFLCVRRVSMVKQKKLQSALGRVDRPENAMGSCQRKNLWVKSSGSLKARRWIRYAQDWRKDGKGKFTRLIRPPINTATVTPPLSFHRPPTTPTP
jgi:hypothetical protein